uniref:NADH-ubiquinone oxidoreductase chain 6 n=1 Tax=Episcapha fortunii TaxID=2819887 RepID=A0A977LJS9_9CUCU|nr:NADH dehydrogenase subunit 6 [Episcapha fortunii]UXF64394.1 NADH dehydrogenase subunit 6 [Episcapha fortunii]
MILYLISFSMSLTFLFLSHPLSLGLILLIQTICISMISGMMYINYWYSYILFLIMIGGMLILFLYMTSIASNEKFKSSNLLILLMLLMTTISMFLLKMDTFFFSTLNQNSMLTPQNIKILHIFNILKYMNMPMMMVTLMIISYLFVSLIAVVKIININYGPLRQKF